MKIVRKDSQLLRKEMKEANASSSRMSKRLDGLRINDKSNAKQKLKPEKMKLKKNNIEKAEHRKMLKTKQLKVKNVANVFP